MEIIKGRKNATNGLWYIPIIDDKQQPQYIPVYNNTPPNAANNVDQTSTMSETIQFLHQCLFSPTVDTLCKAIDNDQLIGFPFLTSSLVQKYLPESTATAKSHMNRNKKNLRSTTNSPASKIPIEQDFRPTTDKNAEVELFIGATIANTHDGTIYTDQTGNFPVRSFHGKRCKFIAYEYRSNAILCRALKDQTDASMIKAFQDV